MLETAEMVIIARDAADKAMDKIKQELPTMMKPTLYEVSESVAANVKKEFADLLSGILGADILDKAQMREVTADFYFLRQQRLQKAADAKVIREILIKRAVLFILALIGLGFIAWLAAKGIVNG